MNTIEFDDETRKFLPYWLKICTNVRLGTENDKEKGQSNIGASHVQIILQLFITLWTTAFWTLRWNLFWSEVWLFSSLSSPCCFFWSKTGHWPLESEESLPPRMPSILFLQDLCRHLLALDPEKDFPQPVLPQWLQFGRERRPPMFNWTWILSAYRPNQSIRHFPSQPSALSLFGF